MEEWNMSKKKNHLHGHYCKICGQYRANEKFSGKGHAAHICKSCSRLSAAEKGKAMTMNKLENFSMRRFTNSERKWLENKTHDKRPEIAEKAKAVYKTCFPYAERNAKKKQLLINMLSFEIHTEVYDMDDDIKRVDQCFSIDRKKCVLTMTDFHTDSEKKSITLEKREISKLLRHIVHALEIFMWEQDYSMFNDDTLFFPEEDFWVDDLEENEEVKLPKKPEVSPSWRVQVEYANHTEQDTSGYDDYLLGRPEELYFSLLEYFEPEDEKFF